MNIHVFLFSVLYCFVNVSVQCSGPYTSKTKSLPVVDALISKLQQERWPDDGGCLRATLDMLEGVNNRTLWATWVWDSMQLPAGSMYGLQAHIGNYDQCLQAAWSADRRHPGLRAQYCTVDVNTPEVEQTDTFGPYDDAAHYYRTPTKDGRRFSQYSFGVCLPSICSSSSVVEITRHLLQLTHLPLGDVTVDPRNCDTAGEELHYPVGFYMFWIVVGVLIATMVISTLFCSDDRKQTAWGTIIQSFCMKRNYRNLFTVSGDEVRVMHGMRCITAALIVITHVGYFTMMFPVVNGLDINKFTTSPLGLLVMHLEVVVDTFFTMSGLLLVRGLMMGKQKNVFCTLIKRYIRLIGPYALSIMYYTTTSQYMSSGPLWRKFNSWETDVCEKYWWKSLLMANTNITTVCYVATWYISCEFQLAILGTFLFCLFKRSRNLGIVTFVLVAVSLTVNLGLTVYWNHLDMLPFSFKVIISKREYTDLNYTYLPSHARAGPYLVGMVMGYIITTYKPTEHRNAINKKWSVTIATMSLLSALSVLAVAGIFAGRPYDPLEAAVVVATNRVIWGIAICSFIGVCEYGTISLVPEFLSWSGFVPHSKLSYCTYLLHSILLQRQMLSARNAATYSIYNTHINALGVLVLTCVVSLVFHLSLEAPLINISNAVFADKSISLEQNRKSRKVEMTRNRDSVSTQQEQNGHKAKLS